jgi:ribosomal-protein-alanine N-acetyltransferase
MRHQLKPLTLADEQAFLTAARRSRRLHRPWVYPPDTRAGFAGLARHGDPARERMLLWFQDRDCDQLVGYFSLSQIVRGGFNCAYLGYWAFAPHAGHGHMRSGMELLLRHAFRSTRLHRVEANIQPGNHVSIALARSSGFRKEGFSPRYLKVGGRWRDHERWAMTVEDWRARGPRARNSG